MAEPRNASTQNSTRAVLFIASTYVYFLIFAQFGFLKRLTQLNLTERTLTPVMASMALGGILASLFAQKLLHNWTVPLRLRTGFVACALAAYLTLLPLNAITAAAVASLIGLALGLLTVTLVAHLNRWTTSLLTVALGTGLGYLLCNIPWLFEGAPSRTALVSAAACLLAAAAVNNPQPINTAPDTPHTNIPFPSVLLAFTALIWLDSAAFFIIQNSPALKAGTWGGARHLLTNGALHLLAALTSAYLLRRRGLLTTLLTAFAFIGAACLLLHDPSRAPLASLLYPAGVSLYSVALVAYPSLLLTSTSLANRERQAGLIYAIAGWCGSAMGIGMGQHLHRVPTLFVLLAGAAIAASFFPQRLLTAKAPAAAVVATALLALFLQRTLPHPTQPATPTAIAQGRQIYIAEGCINCHSQYVRPRNVADVTMWGPGSDVEAIRRQHPPLIGNRRQGPDLSEVGGRRSPLWLRIHFLNPRDLSYRSIMPSYAYLFNDSRGDALIAYTKSLNSPGNTAHLHQMLTTWTPGTESPSNQSGAELFQEHCATCHVASGAVRTKYSADFHRLPPNLFADPLPYLGQTQQTLQLERILKFGIPGTDMPGHEYLPDADLVTLAHWVLAQRESNAARTRS